MRSLFLAASLLSLACPLAAQAQIAKPAIDEAAARALGPIEPGRLTGAAKPQHYRLDLTLDPSKDRFTGHAEIDVVLQRPSRFIDLHGNNLLVTRSVATIAGKTYEGRFFQLDPSGNARLVFDHDLPAGTAVLSFDYSGAFGEGPSGLFRVKVGDDWYSWSQFQSTDARAAFPSFDEPGYKTPFSVTLRTPAGLTAVSNAPEISTTRDGAMDVHRYAPTLPLPTYLMAMMVGPFAVLEGAVPPTPQRAKPLPLRIVTTKQNAQKMSYALEGSKGIVKHLEAYFNQGFPYPKLDQITSPIMPGAMENAGADLYADPLLILDEKAPVGQKRLFGMVVSHELAHQWFGDLVTPAWWDDIWLNESFANWMGYRIGHEWQPDLNIAGDALAEGFSAMNTDALLAGRAIRQPINTTAQINEAFDSITYGKGGHVVAMIAGYMGDERFRDGVRRYMAAHTYGNATSDDFFTAMAEAAGDPRIVPAMKSFVDQQGVPLVTFSRGKGGNWTATQSRYVRLGSTPPETRWGIPVCVRPVGAAQNCTLLTDQSVTLRFKGRGALVPNAGGTGYYRFELPKKDWDGLIKIAARLPAGEALALDDSLLASFRAGRATARQMVQLARNLIANPASHASDAGIDSLRALADTGMLDTAGDAGFRRLVAQIYGPRVKDFGFDLRTGSYAKEDPERTKLRENAVAQMVRNARDPALRKQMADAAAAWLDGNKAALDPAWYGMALDVWQAQAGFEGSKRLVDMALSSEDPLFRPIALDVAGNSGSTATARWLLDELKDQRLRRSEKIDILGAVMRNRETRDYGFEWFRANFDDLTKGGDGIVSLSRLPNLLSRYCSAAKADEIATLFRPRLAGKTGALDLERTIERVRACGILKEARGAELSAELARIR